MTTANSTHGSPGDQPESATKGTTSILDCCENGDLARLKELLSTQSTTEPSTSAHDMLMRACKANQPRIVQYVIKQFPGIQTTSELHKAAFAGGTEVYGIILHEYPKLKDHSFGHTSDPISEAVLNEDAAMLELLLARGFDAKISHYCYVPVRQPRPCAPSLFAIELTSLDHLRSWCSPKNETVMKRSLNV